MAQQTTRRRRRYATGDAELDAGIEELVRAADLADDADLATEMVTSIVRMARGKANRGELKLVNAALKEFAYAFGVFAPYRHIRKASIFGSSRVTAEDPSYACAREFASRISDKGWMVITGAGPGVMEAGQEGAGAEQSFGLNIRLPFASEANPIIESDPKLINFRYFFTRKVTFLKESDAFVLLPGGFGTLDEAFELLTLVQTGKSDLHPVVRLEPPGGTYWAEWWAFVEERLAQRGLISRDDLHLLHHTDDVDTAVREVVGFYRNYQSQRYVEGRLVLRLRRAPGKADLARLSRRFADILERGRFEVVPPLPAEVADDDALDCDRLAFYFNRRSYGRLREFVDELNRL
jgi:uncharacterized protein (TIGR00730 family)